MSKTTKVFMAGFRARLRAYVKAEMTHCGHDDLVLEATEKHQRLIEFVQTEHDALARKAGLP